MDHGGFKMLSHNLEIDNFEYNSGTLTTPDLVIFSVLIPQLQTRKVLLLHQLPSHSSLFSVYILPLSKHFRFHDIKRNN